MMPARIISADSLTVYDLGHSDKTDILAEGCDRHAAEKGRQRAHEAIDGDGAGRLHGFVA